MIVTTRYICELLFMLTFDWFVWIMRSSGRWSLVEKSTYFFNSDLGWPGRVLS